MLGDQMLITGGWGGVKKATPLNAPINMARGTGGALDKVLADSASGGEVQDSEYVHVLNTRDMTWGKPQFQGTAISVRFGNSVVNLGSQLLYFGGWDGNQALN